MTLLHKWDQKVGINPRSVQCSVHPDDPTDRFHPQSASDSGSRNSGGTTVAAMTPERLSIVSIGGLDMIKALSMPGDNYISGSGTHYRTDMYIPAEQTEADEDRIVAYHQIGLMRPGVDYTKPNGSNFATVIWGFHRGGAGWPGGNMWLTYCSSSAISGTSLGLWGDKGANVASGPYAWQPGSIVLEMYGGPWPKQSDPTTPHYINMEQWQFLPSGIWDSKFVEMAWKVKWSANWGEDGGTFYKDFNGGKPKDYSKSGWVEMQFRLGDMVGNWSDWTPYDGGTITFKNGGSQIWSNGPEKYRHYRPMIFKYQDTGVADKPYQKVVHNYRYEENTTSSIYTAGHAIADQFSDFPGVPEIGEVPVPPTPPPGPSVDELIDSAITHFKASTITYSDWKHRVDSGFYASKKINPATQTEWGKGFADLDAAKAAS